MHDAPGTGVPPRALFAGASRRWVRLLPWGLAFVLSVALLPTTLQVLTAAYGLHGGTASALAVAQSAPLLLAVVRPLHAWYVVFLADVAGALALLTADLEPSAPLAVPANGDRRVHRSVPRPGPARTAPDAGERLAGDGGRERRPEQ